MSLRVPRSRLQKVLYGPERVKCIVKGLRSVLDLLKPLVKVSNPLINEKIAEAFWDLLKEFATCIRVKHTSMRTNAVLLLPNQIFKIIIKSVLNIRIETTHLRV